MLQWSALSDRADFQSALNLSRTAPVYIFKHSTRCPISARAFQQLQGQGSALSVERPVHLVKVIEQRSLSNRIAQELGVEHQSPQLLKLVDGAVVAVQSHFGISLAAMEELE